MFLPNKAIGNCRKSRATQIVIKSDFPQTVNEKAKHHVQDLRRSVSACQVSPVSVHHGDCSLLSFPNGNVFPLHASYHPRCHLLRVGCWVIFLRSMLTVRSWSSGHLIRDLRYWAPYRCHGLYLDLLGVPYLQVTSVGTPTLIPSVWSVFPPCDPIDSLLS